MTTSDMPAYVTSRTVGAATITAISDGSGRSSILGSLAVPREEWRREVDADDRDEITLGYNVAHVRLGAASILIDLGFDDPGPASPWRAPRHQRTPGVVAGLAAIGVRPEGITHVLITHAHGDHVAGGAIERAGRWVPRYPNATYFLGRADWEGITRTTHMRVPPPPRSSMHGKLRKKPWCGEYRIAHVTIAGRMDRRR